MNVFWLDLDPMKSAQYACDQHVVKMTTEHAQILLTVLEELGFGKQPMQTLGMTKQLLQWVYADWANFAYLYELTREYYLEYVHRYNKFEHGGWFVLHQAIKDAGGLRAIRQAFKRIDHDASGDVLYSAMRFELHLYVTVPPLYMDEQYKRSLHGPRVNQLLTVIDCYREFYKHNKSTFARYRHRDAPPWMRDFVRV